MRRLLKPVALWIASVVIFVGLYLSLSYHGPTLVGDTPEDQVDLARVVEAARRLRGTFYDPLQGRYRNIGGCLGFIVCSDVPVIAYGNAGYSIRLALQDDFRLHPEHYDTRDRNTPANPYFHRRARNLYSYCRGNGRLLSRTAAPRVGDVAFYKMRDQSFVSHVAVVSRVDPDGTVFVVEAAPLITREVPAESLEKRGWMPQGYGRIVRTNDATRQVGHSSVFE